MEKATHIFSAKNMNVFAIFQDRNFNVTLANNFKCFEQMGPSVLAKYSSFSEFRQ